MPGHPVPRMGIRPFRHQDSPVRLRALLTPRNLRTIMTPMLLVRIAADAIVKSAAATPFRPAAPETCPGSAARHEREPSDAKTWQLVGRTWATTSARPGPWHLKRRNCVSIFGCRSGGACSCCQLRIRYGRWLNLADIDTTWLPRKPVAHSWWPPTIQLRLRTMRDQNTKPTHSSLPTTNQDLHLRWFDTRSF